MSNIWKLFPGTQAADGESDAWVLVPHMEIERLEAMRQETPDKQTDTVQTVNERGERVAEVVVVVRAARFEPFEQR